MRVRNDKRTRVAVAALLTAAIAVTFLAAQVTLASPPATTAVAAAHGSTQAYEYVGSKKCKACHLPQYKSWEKTLMANTIDVLKPGERVDAKLLAELDPDADYTGDPKCLECHSVGYGKPGGFVSLKETPELAGTGCESCHGAGGGYVADNVMGNSNKKHSFEEVIAKGLIYPVGEDTCRQCHNDRSPFNAEMDAKYDWVYSKENMAEQTHRHMKLKYDHGPLPAGTLFQKQH